MALASGTRLNRDVAIKVLPDAFARDRDRLARFTREAQTLASLNHPNIAQIYGIENNTIVMELVDGEDLSVRGARGPISVNDALPIATQIAEAVEAAHELGIIHRDLKPANIKVRADGTVKVLDAELANSPTMTSSAMTEFGLILGTAAYMSPEQAAGKVVDKRSDLWSFGVVLYEMLTGQRRFTGETVSHVMAAVLTKDPDWTTLPPNTLPQIRRLLRRCLERDHKRRLDSAAAARALSKRGGPVQHIWRKSIVPPVSVVDAVGGEPAAIAGGAADGPDGLRPRGMAQHAAGVEENRVNGRQLRHQRPPGAAPEMMRFTSPLSADKSSGG